MGIRRLSSPTESVVTLDLAKLQLREVEADQDALIISMIASATTECERLCSRPLLESDMRLACAGFPASGAAILLPGATSVTEVAYYDAQGTRKTLAEGVDWVASVLDDARTAVAPAVGRSWPFAASLPAAVQVDFRSGWPTSEVPAPIRQWILLRVAAYYLHREAWTLGLPIQRNAHIDAMVAPYALETL